MTAAFTPSLKDLQRDVERYLESAGQCEKNEQGQKVYRGYQAAFSQLYRLYMDREAFGPLVAEFRKWNWEWNYDVHLLELTSALHRRGEWSLLEELWAAVVAKRRTNYNKTRKARRSVPERIPKELVTKTRDLLLESLHRIQRYASELGHASDVTAYVEMTARVEKEMQA